MTSRRYFMALASGLLVPREPDVHRVYSFAPAPRDVEVYWYRFGRVEVVDYLTRKVIHAAHVDAISLFSAPNKLTVFHAPFDMNIRSIWREHGWYGPIF